ncbi:MAG: methyltransferase domain-containing protein [Pseudomonadota bacterium]
MFDKKIIKVNFNQAAANYDKNAKLQETIRKQAAKIATNYFPGKAKVLDLGCGTAEFAIEQKNWEVIGIDISYGMCAVAAGKNTVVINADASFLPIKDDSVDAVFSSLALQWVEKPEVTIKEILRVLKPQGTAVITIFVDGTLSELEEAFKAVDSKPHISKFVEAGYLLLQTAHMGGMMLEVGNEQTYIEYYDDILSLMRSVKNIGASNKLTGRRKGLMTPAQLKKLEKAYKLKDGKYPLKWNVLTMVIGKPSN